ncbi:MAG: hypothetical protein AB8F74_00300 [Saprospiraceae bacterium]
MKYARDMFQKLKFLIPLFILSVNMMFAQELLDINTNNRCVYSGTQMDEELYVFSPESKEMESRVKNILKVGGNLKINFYLVETNVQNVSAVVDGKKRFLLWSQDFFLNASPIEKIGMTAHEMAHHLNRHRLTEDRKEKEEAEADFFMGFIFSKSGFPLEAVKDFVKSSPLSGDHGFNEKRFENITAGYKKGSAAREADNGLSWDGQNASMNNFLKAQFPFPPPECHTSYEIPNIYFNNCNNLGQLSKRITRSLEGKQYPYRFMSVPNGFAIVTQMEQYKEDGNIMNGSSYRWVDYPPQESFALSWDYFKSLIYPKKARLRLFVFIVTNQNYSTDKKRVSKQEAASWLSQGVNRLPKSIAEEPFHSDYSVSFLTYEFEVPESNHLVRQSCPCHLQAVDHLDITGLRKLIGGFP